MSAVQPALQRDADLRAELDGQREANRALMVDLENAETELRVYRRENGRLKTELEKARGQHIGQGDANRVFDHWCQRFGKRKGTKFGEARQRKVKARLREGFSADDLCKAVDGCHRAPFQLFSKHVAKPHPQATRRDGLDYICQDEASVERFVQIAEHGPEDEQMSRQTGGAKVVPIRRDRRPDRTALDLADHLEFASGLSVRDHGFGRWSAQCPSHDDSDPSLSIRECEDGTILIHCFAGCTTEEVVKSIGWEMRDLMGGGVTSRDREARYQAAFSGERK